MKRRFIAASSRAIGRSNYRKAHLQNDKFAQKQIGISEAHARANYELKKKEAALGTRKKTQFGSGTICSYSFDVENEENKKKAYEKKLSLREEDIKKYRSAYSSVVGTDTLAALYVKKYWKENSWLAKFVGRKLTPRMVEVVMEIVEKKGWTLK